MLIELIFKGLYSSLNFSFLEKFLFEAKEIRFNFPENQDSSISFDESLSIIHSNEYVDLTINTDHIEMSEKIVPRVFINFGRNNNEIELFFFFDVNDLNEQTLKKGIDFVRNWSKTIRTKYDFQYFICQMDNADSDEYYFDSNGIGKLYDDLG